MIEPHAIGEELVAALLHRIISQSVKTKAREELRIIFPAATTFLAEAQLAPLKLAGSGLLGTDGKHCIDVLGISANQAAIAVEVKLGESLSPGKFRKKLLEPPSLSGHSPCRLGGPVPGLLNARFNREFQKFIELPEQPLYARVNDTNVKIGEEWVLVARKKTLSSLEPIKGCRFLAFETLVHAAGKDNLDDIVLDIVGKSNFYEGWCLH